MHPNVQPSGKEVLALLGNKNKGLREALFQEDWAGAEEIIREVIAKTEPRKLPEKTFKVPVERKIHPFVYLPVEIKSREWASKLTITKALVEKGFHVVIGQTWSMSMGGFYGFLPGIVLFKTMNGFDGWNMKAARQNGHFVACLDEEALTRVCTPWNMKLNTHPDAAEACDLVLTQGEDQKQALLDIYPGLDIVVTGNPRAAMPEDQKSAPLESENEFTLFCTMSGNINNTRPLEIVCADALAVSDPEIGREAMLQACLRELAALPQMKQAILQCEGDYVIRPHPVESHDLWKKWFPEARVTNEGSVRGWIERATVTRHVSECGTGLDASFVGKPHFPVDDGPQTEADENFILRGDAAGRIAEALFELYQEHKTEDGTDVERALIRQSGFKSTEFHESKFPSTSEEDVREILKDLGVWTVEKNVFLVSKRESISENMRERLLNRLKSGHLTASTDKIDKAKRIKDNIAKGYPSIIELKNKYHNGIACICGSGSSLADTLPELKELVSRGAKVCAVNTAYEYLEGLNIKVDFGIMCDAREHIKTYVKKPRKHSKFLLAATTHPEVLKKFPNTGRTFLWHAINPSKMAEDIEFLKSLNIVFSGVTIGTTTGIRAISVMHVIGFREIHMFGLDSSCKVIRDDEGKEQIIGLHATGKNPKYVDRHYTQNQYHSKLRDETRTWITNDAMAVQALEFEQDIYQFGNLIRMNRMDAFMLMVHGDGMLPYIAAEHDMHAEYERNRTPFAEKILQDPGKYSAEQVSEAMKHLKRKSVA